MVYERSREQQLVDIMFQIGLTTRENPIVKMMTRDEYCEWVAYQLRQCGFDTFPCGASWGVLK